MPRKAAKGRKERKKRTKKKRATRYKQEFARELKETIDLCQTFLKHGLEEVHDPLGKSHGFNIPDLLTVTEKRVHGKIFLADVITDKKSLAGLVDRAKKLVEAREQLYARISNEAWAAAMGEPTPFKSSMELSSKLFRLRRNPAKFKQTERAVKKARLAIEEQHLSGIRKLKAENVRIIRRLLKLLNETKSAKQINFM